MRNYKALFLTGLPVFYFNRITRKLLLFFICNSLFYSKIFLTLNWSKSTTIWKVIRRFIQCNFSQN